MHSMPSEPDEPLARRPWVLAALLVLAVLLTLQALAIRPSLPALATLWLAIGFCLLGLRHVVAPGYLSYLYVILVTAALGHLGLLIGVTQDLGSAGLVILASWCSVRVDYGLGDAFAMWRVAPWGHLGMLLGCNLGMLVSGCSDLPAMRYGMSKGRFLLLCNFGMLTGMVAAQLWQPGIAGGGIASAAALMSLQMLSGMALGMAGTWWVLERLYTRSAAGSALVVGGGR